MLIEVVRNCLKFMFIVFVMLHIKKTKIHNIVYIYYSLKNKYPHDKKVQIISNHIRFKHLIFALYAVLSTPNPLL